MILSKNVAHKFKSQNEFQRTIVPTAGTREKQQRKQKTDQHYLINCTVHIMIQVHHHHRISESKEKKSS